MKLNILYESKLISYKFSDPAKTNPLIPLRKSTKVTDDDILTDDDIFGNSLFNRYEIYKFNTGTVVYAHKYEIDGKQHALYTVDTGSNKHRFTGDDFKSALPSYYKQIKRFSDPFNDLHGSNVDMGFFDNKDTSDFIAAFE